jgi:hypothetical protein
LHEWGSAVRAVELARLAAEAELLRIRQMVKRQGIRATLGAIAAIFAIGVLTLASVAAWQLLRQHFDPINATLILLGVYLVMAILFGVLAMRSAPSRTEREALDVRKQALAQFQRSIAIGTLIPIAGSLWRMQRGKPKSSGRRRFFSRG